MIDPQHTDWRVVALTASITTLIGAAVGFAAAIMSDLMKTNLSDRRKQKRMRHALYTEMAWLYTSLDALFTEASLKNFEDTIKVQQTQQQLDQAKKELEDLEKTFVALASKLPPPKFPN